MSTVIVTEDNFSDEIFNSSIPVLVDFWASWCAPCKSIAPVLEQVSNELSGKVKVAKINVNDEPDLAHKYRISSIPTMLLFRNGKVTDSFVGALSKEQIVGLVTKQ